MERFDPAPPDSVAVKQEITREILKVHEDSFGTAGSNFEVAIEPDLVVAIMDIELSTTETILTDVGSEQSVMTCHEAYRHAIAATYTAIIERATGRTVTEFTTRTVVTTGAAWSVDVFRLRAIAALN
jgi:uncharacterized protein YbcI